MCQCASCFLFCIGFCLFASVINLRGPGPVTSQPEHGENQNQFPKLPFTEDSSAEPCSRYMDLFLFVYKIFPSKWDHNNNLNEWWMQVPVLRPGSIVKIFVLCSCRIEEEYLRGHESWKVALTILSAGLELSRQLGILPSNMCRCWGAALVQIEPRTMMFTARASYTTTTTASPPRTLNQMTLSLWHYAFKYDSTRLCHSSKMNFLSWNNSSFLFWK